jgi:apolipoprotein N-acyltransferase
VESSTDITPAPWYRSTLAVALAGSVLLWAALPPLSFGWLGWFAPVPWLLLVRRSDLPGRRSYVALYFAGLVFWLTALHWLRLPHPALYLGWVALAAYLALYLPVFVGLSRVAVHRVGAPLWLAAPVVWTGLELARAHLLTGFLMGSLAHTQVHWPQLIQISDLFGEYGVDFVVMLVASCIAQLLPANRVVPNPGAVPSSPVPPSNRTLPRVTALLPAVIVMFATLVYGHWRINQAQNTTREASAQLRGPRIALIQGNSLAEWKFDSERERQIMDEYIKLSEDAVAAAKRDGRPVDLLVWPETMFRTPLITFDDGYQRPADATRTIEEVASLGPNDLAGLVSRLDTPVLVGVDRAHYPAGNADENPLPPDRFNSAVLVDRDGRIIGIYDKNHRVMFGEYIPFAEYFPLLYRVTPLTGGIDAGREPVVFELNGHFYAPSICYETVLPHVMRRQALATAGENDRAPADVLINITNDAWYWGSSELDQHLACGVFRAVETRRPLVIAANSGVSAWIDRTGTVRATSPKQQRDAILADVELGPVHSWYVTLGDWFAGLCLICCVIFAVIGWKASRTTTKTRSQGDRETRR